MDSAISVFTGLLLIPFALALLALFTGAILSSLAYLVGEFFNFFKPLHLEYRQMATRAAFLTPSIAAVFAIFWEMLRDGVLGWSSHWSAFENSSILILIFILGLSTSYLADFLFEDRFSYGSILMDSSDYRTRPDK